MKILIIYGSNTGNTKQVVDFIIKDLQSSIKHITVDILNSKDLNTKYSLDSSYRLIIFACSTWGIVPPVMQEDFANFWQNLSKASINEQKFAVVGLGDSYYPHFCGAVDIIEDDINKYGAKLIISSLEIDMPLQEQTDNIIIWLNNLKKVLLSL